MENDGKGQSIAESLNRCWPSFLNMDVSQQVFFYALQQQKEEKKKRIPFLEMNPKKEKTAERSDEG